MTDRRKAAVIATGVGLVLAAGGAAIAGAASDDDDGAERAIGGRALDRASAAALATTGGGQVTGTEVGDEEGAYEVEVTRADGSQVDVHLDQGFRVLSTEDDGQEDEREDSDR